jgi:hypothetical protein
MSLIRMNIRNVAIIMLMLILTMPAAVRAYSLEMMGSETTHAFGGGCHDADSDADHDSTGNHQFDVRCCELDTPYVLPSSHELMTPAVIGEIVSPFNGRQLDGYSRRIYKPPR